MGLDATVYCDCYERGIGQKIPPHPEHVFVASDGSLECTGDNLEMLLAFDNWINNEACVHKNGVALTHRLGNLAIISLLRKLLSVHAMEFPLILKKVIYNGSHGGDHLTLEQVNDLKEEVAHLSQIHCLDAEEEMALRTFQRQLQELVDVSLLLKKPIAF